MSSPKMWRKRFQPIIVSFVAVLLLLAGCASKAELSSFSDDRFDFTTIRKVAVVLEDKRGHNPLFGDIFMDSAFEKMQPFLFQREYALRENIAETDLGERVDAFLEIMVSESTQGTLTYKSPTTLGVYAKLVETATGNTVWEKSYAYRSAKFGHSAPLINEAMKLASDEILDSIPLVKRGASMAEAAEPTGDLQMPRSQTAPPAEAEAAPQQKAASVKTPVAAQSRPVEIHPAIETPSSLRVINTEKETAPQANAASASGGQSMVFSVQAGAFLQRDNATEMISLLKRKGFSPYIFEKLDSGKRVWHTVHVGKYATRSEAEAAAKTISNKAGIATTLHLIK